MADMLTPAQNAALEAILPLINGFINPPKPPPPPPPIVQPPSSKRYGYPYPIKGTCYSLSDSRRKGRNQALPEAVAALALTPKVDTSNEAETPVAPSLDEESRILLLAANLAVLYPESPPLPAKVPPPAKSEPTPVTFLHDHAGVIDPLEAALSQLLIEYEDEICRYLGTCAPYDGHRSALCDLLAFRRSRGLGNMECDRYFEFPRDSLKADFTIDATTGVCWIGYTPVILDPEVFGDLHGALAAGEVVAGDDGIVRGLKREASNAIIQDLWDEMVIKESRFAVLSNGSQLIIFERTATNVLSMSDIIGNAPSTVGNIVVGEFPIMFALTTLEPSSYRLPGHGHPSDPPLSPKILPAPMISSILWPAGPIAVTAVPSAYNRFLPISDKTPFLFSKSVSSTHDDTSPMGTPSTTSTLIPTEAGLVPHTIHLSDLVGQGSVWDVYTVDFANSPKEGRPSLIAKICRPSIFPALENGSGEFTRPIAQSSIAVEVRAYATELQAILPGVVPVFYGCYSMEMNGDVVYMMIMENAGWNVEENAVDLWSKREQHHVLYQYQELHKAGIVHNDVHPRNWCLSSEDKADFRIIDFGQSVSSVDTDQEGQVVDLADLMKKEIINVRGWLLKVQGPYGYQTMDSQVWERPREGKWVEPPWVPGQYPGRARRYLGHVIERGNDSSEEESGGSCLL